MKEYRYEMRVNASIVAVTLLLNERAEAGWMLHTLQVAQRSRNTGVTGLSFWLEHHFVFEREASAAVGGGEVGGGEC